MCISVLYLSNVSFKTVFRTTSELMRGGKKIITGNTRLKILHSSTFKSVHTCRGDFLKHVLYDKNLSVSKYLHVKTATKYAECVKTLMKGGGLPD